MYVCLCNAVTDKDVHTAVCEGHRTVEAVAERTYATSGCGACTERVCELVAALTELHDGGRLVGPHRTSAA
ncbi:MAG: (2Fe-2S)-binding protein [Actinomycetota bacterium]|nr:MAG: (2Fe-2S)-binding protein [Actinomycetota bacterium]